MRAIGGYIDVLTLKHGERVGIEVETGKSDAVASVRNCLRSKFDRVNVVATIKSAMDKCEREPAEADLFIPGRLELARRDLRSPETPRT